MALPEARTDGFGEVAACDEVALSVDGDRQLRQGTGGGPEDDRGAVRDVELRLVARAQEVVRLLLVQCDGAADVRADLGVGDDAVVRPVGAVGRLVAAARAAGA